MRQHRRGRLARIDGASACKPDRLRPGKGGTPSPAGRMGGRRGPPERAQTVEKHGSRSSPLTPAAADAPRSCAPHAPRPPAPPPCRCGACRRLRLASPTRSAEQGGERPSRPAGSTSQTGSEASDSANRGRVDPPERGRTRARPRALTGAGPFDKLRVLLSAGRSVSVSARESAGAAAPAAEKGNRAGTAATMRGEARGSAFGLLPGPGKAAGRGGSHSQTSGLDRQKEHGQG